MNIQAPSLRMMSQPATQRFEGAWKDLQTLKRLAEKTEHARILSEPLLKDINGRDYTGLETLDIVRGVLDKLNAPHQAWLRKREAEGYALWSMHKKLPSVSLSELFRTLCNLKGGVSGSLSKDRVETEVTNGAITLSSEPFDRLCRLGWLRDESKSVRGDGPMQKSWVEKRYNMTPAVRKEVRRLVKRSQRITISWAELKHAWQTLLAGRKG